MNLKVDKLGRVVLPKPLRQRYGIRPGTALAEGAGVFSLRPVDRKPSMVRIGGWWVHQGMPESGIDLARNLEQVRDERDMWNMALRG